MTLEVIAAGLGRNGTLAMKYSLEALGFGPCHHMSEVFADARRQIPLWLEAINGDPDWEQIFAGYASTSDYPSAMYWRELADAYPNARIVLATRDPDTWFDSVQATIFAPRMRSAPQGSPVQRFMSGTIFDSIGGDVTDRAVVTEWYTRRNQAVIDGLPADRLLVFHPREGWEPLCVFLGVPVPQGAFPRINVRDRGASPAPPDARLPGDPASLERFGRFFIDQMRERAFASRA